MTGISICRIAGGKIVETWNSSDGIGLMQRLSLIPKRG